MEVDSMVCPPLVKCPLLESYLRENQRYHSSTASCHAPPITTLSSLLLIMKRPASSETTDASGKDNHLRLSNVCRTRTLLISPTCTGCFISRNTHHNGMHTPPVPHPHVRRHLPSLHSIVFALRSLYDRNENQDVVTLIKLKQWCFVPVDDTMIGSTEMTRGTSSILI